MPLLSIVLTTYKDLAYFLEINQTFISTIKEFDNVELIIVDDSSTYQEAWLGANQFLDNKLNNIITLCTLKNLKQGGARNLAISIATGEYLWFIDSDDKPHIKSAINAAREKKADFIINNFKYEITKKTKNFQIEDFSCKSDLKISEIKTNGSHALDAAEVLFLMSSNSISAACWPYFYRRQFLIDRKILFQEHVFFEDLIFNSRFISGANVSVFYTGVTIYTHLIRSNSSSTTKNFSRAIMRFKQSLKAANLCLKSKGKLRVISAIFMILYHGLWASK